jgi:hypothetical protein
MIHAHALGGGAAESAEPASFEECLQFEIGKKSTTSPIVGEQERMGS